MRFSTVALIMIVRFLANVRSYKMPYVSSKSYNLAKSSTSISAKTETDKNVFDRLETAGIASAASVAAAAVNAAVSMRTLEAPDEQKSYVFRDGGAESRAGKIDEYGLPLVYDKELIQAYWKKQGSALSQRWTEFLGYAVPYLTKVVTLLVRGGSEQLNANGAMLAKDAREIFEKLGPTYVKMGQMMSVRPDVLPPAALEELKILQDSVKPFGTDVAIQQIESELGGNLNGFFTEISTEPVAAASLAQVYKAKLASTGEFVAVKVQRPRVLETVSKDLYVLRRAAEVYQGLIERFAPQQRTNYVALLNEWAVGFYTELDFLNEAANQQKIKDLLVEQGVDGLYVPKVYNELCTRRLLVSEWIDGQKLSSCEPAEIKTLIPDAQEAFLTQLLQVGFFHADCHPGNIMKLNEPKGRARMALIDFGLVAAVKQEDRDTMISSIIHLANRDYPSLVDDFIALEILPKNCDRGKVIPLMDKALTPYVKGGGAKKYEEEIRKQYGMDGSIRGTTGGFQAMTQDALTVLNDIPFSIPPYFALLGRAIITLEGIALTGDPDYGIITEAYPFVARKLLSEDRPVVQKALQEVLYSNSMDAAGRLKTSRFTVLLNSALGNVARNSGGMVDIDSLPEDTVGVDATLRLLLSPSTASLRKLLLGEVTDAVDILTRQAVRKTFNQVTSRLPLRGFMSRFPFLPTPESLPLPIFIPSQAEAYSSQVADTIMQVDNKNRIYTSYAADGQEIVQDTRRFEPDSRGFLNGRTVVSSLEEVIEVLAPKLTRDEELYALSLVDLVKELLGEDAAKIINGDTINEPQAALRTFTTIIRSLTGGAVDPSTVQRVNNMVENVESELENQENLKKIITTLRSLNEEEEEVFKDVGSKMLGSLLERTIVRLQKLG